MRSLFFILLSLFTVETYAQSKPAAFDSLSQKPKHGVVFYDSLQTQKGFTLLDDGDESTTLIDMYGNLIGKLPFGLLKEDHEGNWVGRIKNGLVKLDDNLNIIWKTPVPLDFHHDIQVDDSLNIYILSNEVRLFMNIKTRFDVINKYNSSGILVASWSLYEHLTPFINVISKSKWLTILPKKPDACKSIDDYISQSPKDFLSPCAEPSDTANTTFEFSHFNSIQVLPENQVYPNIPAFKKGNFLISFNPYSSFGIIDINSGKIIWTGFLPERTTLHTPKLTPQGTILVFQNSTEDNLWSNAEDKKEWLKALPKKSTDTLPKSESRLWVSISEYNPIDNQKVWEYVGTPKESLQAKFSGNSDRLANGNTLFCIAQDTTGGMVIEVNSKHEIVWKYISPLNDSETNQPWAYYRARRISTNNPSKLIQFFKQ